MEVQPEYASGVCGPLARRGVYAGSNPVSGWKPVSRPARPTKFPEALPTSARSRIGVGLRLTSVMIGPDVVHTASCRRCYPAVGQVQRGFNRGK